jgi:hypothetical protein
MDVCTAVYFGGVNDDMFETFLRTFRRVSGAHLQVYTDSPKEKTAKWHNDYVVDFVRYSKSFYKGQRCLARMKCLWMTVQELNDGDRLVASDVDVYYLDDPFTAFGKLDFKIGVTRRCHEYKLPINSGQFFINVSPWAKRVFGEEMQAYSKEHPEWHDWYIDQNYLLHLWHKYLPQGLIRDVGWEYNYCPNTDYFGVEKARGMIRRAYESKSVKVLHLKSELMLSLYDGYMDDAVIKKPRGSWNWKKDGASQENG